eukprot:Amastigsp_a845458_22.p2 type:complete len:218 gc:universal Amastigsp_a845458_22:819-1472(+)
MSRRRWRAMVITTTAATFSRTALLSGSCLRGACRSPTATTRTRSCSSCWTSARTASVRDRSTLTGPSTFKLSSRCVGERCLSSARRSRPLSLCSNRGLRRPSVQQHRVRCPQSLGSVCRLRLRRRDRLAAPTRSLLRLDRAPRWLLRSSTFSALQLRGSGAALEERARAWLREQNTRASRSVFPSASQAQVHSLSSGRSCARKGNVGLSPLLVERIQ